MVERGGGGSRSGLKLPFVKCNMHRKCLSQVHYVRGYKRLAREVTQGQGDVRHDKLNFVAAGKGRLSKHGCLVSTAPVRGSGSTALLFQDTN